MATDNTKRNIISWSFMKESSQYPLELSASCFSYFNSKRKKLYVLSRSSTVSQKISISFRQMFANCVVLFYQLFSFVFSCSGKFTVPVKKRTDTQHDAAGERQGLFLSLSSWENRKRSNSRRIKKQQRELSRGGAVMKQEAKRTKHTEKILFLTDALHVCSLFCCSFLFESASCGRDDGMQLGGDMKKGVSFLFLARLSRLRGFTPTASRPTRNSWESQRKRD